MREATASDLDQRKFAGTRTRRMIFMVIGCAMAVSTLKSNAGAEPVLRPLPDKVYGVTIDAIDHLPAIVASLDGLRQMPMTRIVFDEWVPADQYRDAVTRIAPISYILGEILDSFYMRYYTIDQYRSRVTEYLNAFADKVDVWEIGNEINGEWLGSKASVVAKMTAGFDLVKARGGRTALTLYYNYDCWERPENEMFRWVQSNVPARMKQGLDYVLISYYEDDCNGYQPDWQAVFDRLGAMFPNSRIGIGECGTSRKSRKEDYIRRYYGMTVDHPRFVGGWFWWYYKQDMVPMTKPLWSVLDSIIR